MYNSESGHLVGSAADQLAGSADQQAGSADQTDTDNRYSSSYSGTAAASEGSNVDLVYSIQQLPQQVGGVP